MTLADQYYIKAFDNYPCDLEEALESLNYALSYDENHAGANFLMGRIHFEQFNNNKLAEHYFQLSLVENPKSWNTYDWYSHMLIQTLAFERATKMIGFASKLPEARKCSIEHKYGQIAELQGKLKRAKKFYKHAVLAARTSWSLDFYKQEVARIKEKQKLLKPKKKKSKRNKK